MSVVVEVFKTNVHKVKLANELILQLRSRFPQYKVNFDLQDCDKILRVEGNQVLPDKIMEVVHTFGCECQVLE